MAKKQLGIIALIICVFCAGILYSQNQEAKAQDKCDKASFYLGASFSGIRSMVVLAHEHGIISEEEYEELERLEAKAIRLDSETMQAEEVFDYIDYATNLEGLREFTWRDLEDSSFGSEEYRKYELETLSFTEGFAACASDINIRILYENGSISEKEYKRIEKLYYKLIKEPTHKKCDQYIEQSCEILIKYFGEEYSKEQSNTQQTQGTACSGPLAF